MEINADMVGRYLLRMAADIEALIAQRDALAQENAKLRADLETANRKPVLVRSQEADNARQ